MNDTMNYMGQPGFAYTPPFQQTMSTNLEASSGVVIRQCTQFAEAILQSIGIPFEQANMYKVSLFPPGAHAAITPNQPGRWQPSAQELEALPPHMQIREESSCLLRVILAWIGCLNLRELTLHFMEGELERFRAERPCRLGGYLCCPLEMTVMQGSTVLGMAVEDFDNYCLGCFRCCCLCTYYTKVLEKPPTTAIMNHKYTLRTSCCCCGRVNNCCGATCCKNDLIIDVLDEKDQIVATIQKTFAPSTRKGCGAACRCCCEFDNYLVEFPTAATAVQRALLITGLMSVEYELFESTGGVGDDDGDGDGDGAMG